MYTVQRYEKIKEKIIRFVIWRSQDHFFGAWANRDSRLHQPIQCWAEFQMESHKSPPNSSSEFMLIQAISIFNCSSHVSGLVQTSSGSWETARKDFQDESFQFHSVDFQIFHCYHEKIHVFFWCSPQKKKTLTRKRIREMRKWKEKEGGTVSFSWSFILISIFYH